MDRQIACKWMMTWRQWGAFVSWMLLGLPLPANVMDEWEALRKLPPLGEATQLRQWVREIYLPYAEAEEWVRLEEEGVRVRVSRAHAGIWLELPWPEAAEGPAEDSFGPPAARAGEAPLAGWRIALDPGHIGGDWGPMEQRSFRLDEGAVVQEGDLVLATARRLEARLRKLGAEVFLLREEAAPVTEQRPEDFRMQAFRELLAARKEVPEKQAVEKRAESAFYRMAEVKARAEKLRERPVHFVLALHIDAAPWADPEAPAPVPANHGHVLINGAYLPEEIADDRQRLEMARRWLKGYSATEVALGRHLAGAMRDLAGLPPLHYQTANAVQVDGNPYLWARNLLANRIYPAPVIFLEPWVLNNEEIYSWAGLGDYEGEEEVGGQRRRSLPEVYASFVEEGLLRYAEERRRTGNGG